MLGSFSAFLSCSTLSQRATNVRLARRSLSQEANEVESSLGETHKSTDLEPGAWMLSVVIPCFGCKDDGSSGGGGIGKRCALYTDILRA